MNTLNKTNILTTPLTTFLKNSQQGITFINKGDQEDFLAYKDLYQNALFTLYLLEQQGVKQGDEVILQIQDNATFLQMFWACLLGGIIPIPLSVGNKPEQKVKFIKIWSSLDKAYLISDEMSINSLKDFLLAEGNEATWKDIQSRNFPSDDLFEQIKPGTEVEVNIEDLAYIQYSSGSTGNPKGVRLTHANLTTNVYDIVSRSETTAQDAMLSWMPLTHDMGLICFHFSGVMADIPQYLMPTSLFIRRPILWIRKASEHKVSQLYSPNFGYHYFTLALRRNTQELDWDLSNVRIIYNGAEPISYKVCHTFLNELKPYGLAGNTMYPGYGMAEASVAVALPKVGDPLKHFFLNRNHLKVGEAVVFQEMGDETVSFVENGFAIEHCNLRICSDKDEVLGENFIGNIQIKGGNVTDGYYKNPEASEGMFTKDRWLRTGDLGFLREGRIIVTGRAKNIIIINGQNYYPQDFERLVDDNVAGCELGKVVAVGVRNAQQSEEKLVLFVMSKKKVNAFLPTAKAIKKVIQNEIGVHVSAVIPIRRVPKTTSGKIRNFRLVQLYQQGEFDALVQEIDEHLLAELAIDENQPLALRLVQIWAALEIDLNDADDDVIGAGVNSIIATRFINWANRLLSINIGLGDIFLYPTMNKLAAHIEGNTILKLPTIKAAPAQEYYPLSPGQNRIWLLQQFDPANTAYNLSSLHQLEGDFQAELFKKAFEKVLSKYEILRTNFLTIKGKPQQKIKEHEEGRGYYFMDFSEIGSSDSLALETAKKIVTKPYDLAQEPLFEITVMKVGDNSHFLLFKIHHIISDGWSVGQLIAEISRNYNALGSNKTVQVEKLPFQYKDYAIWKEKLVLENHLAKSKAYWSKELATNRPVLNLPMAQPRPAVTSFKGACLEVEFDEKSLKNLRSFSRSQQVTPFITLFTAVNILLHKYTGQEELIIGTDATGRATGQLEKQQGFFLNTLAIRNQFSPEENIKTIIQQVKQKVLAAFQHQDYPFENVLKDINAKADVSRNAIFDVLVLLQNFDHSFGFENQLKEIKASPVNLATHTSLLDLEFEFYYKKQALHLNLKYNPDLFESTQIQRLASHLEQIITGLPANQSTCLADLQLMRPEEKQLVHSFSQGKKATTLPLLASFERCASEFPYKIALKEGNGEMTYQTLNQLSNQWANFLKNDRQLKAGDKVGILLERSSQTIVALLAVLKAGAAFVPIDPEYPHQRIQYIIEKSGLTCLLSTEELLAENPTDKVDCLTIQTLTSQAANYATDNVAITANENDLAYLLYTSGSTGQPKGVMISRAALADYTQSFQKYFDLTTKDKMIQQSSLSFDVAMEEIFPILASGGTLLVAVGGGRDTASLLRLVMTEKATLLSSTPLVIAELNRTPDALKCLRILISGGDVLKPDYIDNLLGQVKIYNTYGPTETTVCVSYQEMLRPQDTVYIGKPTANHQIYIVDEQLNPQPIGIAGELVVAGNGVAQGYFNLAGETTKSFVQNPFLQGSKLYKTGDLGLWDENGSIKFLGRKDQQVKIRGYRIEPEEIRSAILDFGDIKDAAISVVGEKGDKKIIAHIVGTVETDQLKSHLYGQLPNYMVPTFYLAIPAIPRNINGKVAIKALPMPEFSTTETYHKPTNLLERQLCEVWEEVLDKNRLGIHSNFFEEGGNSLKAVKIANLLYQRLKLKAEIKDILMRPTIAELAKILGAKEEFQRITPVATSAYYPLSPAQKHLWILTQLNKENKAFNLSWRFNLTGENLKEKLENAFDKLIEKHETLRTTFTTVETEPVQKIADYEQRTFRVDYTDWVGKYYNGSLETLVRKDASESFDLQNGPLLKVRLIQLKTDMAVGVVTMHHIISDGFSMEVLATELLELMQENGTRVLSPLTTQYKDYVNWQKLAQNTLTGKRNRKFWLDKFAGEIPSLDLPFYQPRLNQPNYKGAVLRVPLTAEMTSSLKQFSQANNATLFVTLLSLVKALLFRYTGQDDLIVGTPTAGRTHPGLEQQIGYYLNMLPVRTKIKEGISFTALVDQVKSSVYEAFEHQNFPIELLIDQIQQRKELNRISLYDVMVVYQNFDNKIFKENKEQSTFQISNIEDVDNGSSLNDLLLEFNEFASDLTLKIRYNTDLFTQEQMNGLADHFKTLAQSVLTAADTQLNKLALLPTTEKEVLLNEFNPQYAVQQPVDVISLFEAQVEKNPSKTAVKCGANSLTYAELSQEVNLLTNYLLKNKGVQNGQKVAVLLNRSNKTIVSFLAILKTGAAYLPIDPEYPQERINYLLENGGINLLISDKEQLDNSLEQLENNTTLQVVIWEDFLAKRIEMAHFVNQNAIQLEEPAYILYTSGSTGQPKGVVISHNALANYVQTFTNYFSLGGTDKVIQQSSLAFDVSVEEIYPILCAGGTLLIAPSGGRDIQQLAELIKTEKATVLSTTPLVIQELNQQVAGLASLRILISGGDKLKGNQLSNFLGKTAIYNTYGPTESTVCATYHKVATAEDAPLIGRPIEGRKVYLLDGSQNLVPIGVKGELYIGGEGLAIGYLDQAEETYKRFLDNPFELGKKYYRTGDWAKWTTEGNLQFLGRDDKQVKVRGHRVELGEIEHKIGQHPEITDVTILLSPQSAQQLVAFYSTANKAELTEIRTWLTNRLPAYMIPSSFIHLDKLPMNDNGKVDRKRLEAFEVILENASFHAPETALQRKITTVWENVLGHTPISINDNFFALGGHSIKATKVAALLWENLKLKVSIADLFMYATIGELAAHLEADYQSEFEEITPLSEQPYYETTNAQKRLWIIDQFEDERRAYNITFAYEINGRLDLPKLQDSLQQLVGRHESLRTTFEMVAEDLKQKIHTQDSLGFTIEHSDLSLEADQAEALHKIALQEESHHFDLAKGPLFKVRVVKKADNSQVVFLTFHHIISDAWSVKTAMSELISYYNASNKLELPALEFQNKAYAKWFNQRLASGALDADRQYWMDNFEGEIPTLKLPTDYPRPAYKTSNGNAYSIEIESVLSKQLLAFSKEQGVTPFITLLAGLKTLFYRYTGQDDITIGTPVAVRESLALQKQIGFFINTLALRTRFSGELNFLKVVETVKTTALHAYGHQDYPFDLLVEDLKLKRELSRSPLFDVMMVMQNAATPEKEERENLIGLDIKEYPVPHSTSQFDLSLNVFEKDDNLSLKLVYNTDLYKEGGIKQMVDHYLSMLSAGLERPEEAINKLDFIPTEEKKQLQSFNSAVLPLAGKGIIAQIEQKAQEIPTAIAVKCDDRSMTFAELNQAANQIAQQLKSRGKVKPGDLIGIMVDRTEKMLATILGILKTGAAYVPIDPTYPETRIQYILEDAKPKLIISQPTFKPYFKETDKLIFLDEMEEMGNAGNLAVTVSPDQMAYVIYTSGSTGKPKGTMISHKNLNALITWAQDEFENDNFDLLFAGTSYCFDLSVFEMFFPLSIGKPLRILPSALSITEYLDKEDNIFINTVPSVIESLLNEGTDFSRVASLNMAGEAIPYSTKERLDYERINVRNLYGPSEDTTYSSCYRFSPRDEIMLIGKPIANTQFYLLDENLNQVPLGLIGEIAIAGDGLSLGYLNRPELTQQKFIDHPFEKGQRLYLTGDLARYQSNGNIEFLGRKDTQVKVRGFRIELGEIEAALIQVTNLKKAVVILNGQGSDAQLCCFYTANQPLDGSDVKSELVQKIPAYMLPTQFKQLAEFPLTPNGKIDKIALSKMNCSSPSKERLRPRNQNEELIAKIWENLLGIEQVGIQDDFFALGGHSLKAVHLLGRLSSQIPVALTLNDIFNNPTIEQLANEIDNRIWASRNQAVAEDLAERADFETIIF